MRHNPSVNYRYVLIPSVSLSDGGSSFDFSNTTTGPMIEVGKQDAKTIVEAGEGKVASLF